MATYTSHYNLTKPEGTERVNIAIINQNMDSIDAQMYKNAQSIIANHGGMAIPSNNNTHAAVSSGQYVYVYNHSSLAEGLYVAKSAISTNGALSLSNLTAVSGGGLNHVYSTLNSNITDINTALRPVNASWITNKNADDYKTTGKFMVSSGWTNIPTPWGILTVTANRTDTIIQEYQAYNKRYIREFRDNTWYPWEQLALNSNMPIIKTVEYTIPNDTNSHDFDLPTGMNVAIFIGARCLTKYISWVDASYSNGSYFGDVTFIGDGKFRYVAKTAGNSTKILFAFLKVS